jgi:tetratricopeptide (TPR) repeat protein
VVRDNAGEQVLEPGGELAGGAVVQLLLSRCTPDGLTALAACEVGDMQCAAVVCLGMKGTMRHCLPLATLLHHEDARLVALAENSLWQIWMRAGSDYGNTVLARAVDLISHERYEHALRVLDGLCALEPRFAEPRHQRGIVLFSMGRIAEAAAAFRAALRRNRHHFSAALNLGHTFAERGNLRAALRHYQYALHLHPRLEGIPEVVRELEAALGRKGA